MTTCRRYCLRYSRQATDDCCGERLSPSRNPPANETATPEEAPHPAILSIEKASARSDDVCVGREYRVSRIFLGILGGAAIGFVFGAMAGAGVGVIFILVSRMFQAPPTTPQIEDYSPLIPVLCAYVGAPIGAVALAVAGGVHSWIATAPEDRATRYRAAARRWLFVRTPVIVLIVAGWIAGAWVFGWVQSTRLDPYRLSNASDVRAPRLAAVAVFVGFAGTAALWGIWATRHERARKRDAPLPS